LFYKECVFAALTCLSVIGRPAEPKLLTAHRPTKFFLQSHALGFVLWIRLIFPHRTIPINQVTCPVSRSNNGDTLHIEYSSLLCIGLFLGRRRSFTPPAPACTSQHMLPSETL